MAFPLPMAMAMAIHDFLSSLSEDEEDEFIESATDGPEELQEIEATAQEAMIERFKKMRAQFVGPSGLYADSMLAGMMGSGLAHVCTLDDTKPQSATKSLAALKPMLSKELDLHTIHRGHYLCGWIAIDDAFFSISSSSLLLEDVTGRLVELAVYGLADMDLPPMQRQRVLASRFPKGKPMVVIEPYYKVRMDSSVGIRIDDAQELVEWREVPTDLISWKKLGNEYFNALDDLNKGSGALACYQRALEAAQPELRLIAVFFDNIATCRFKVGDYVTSIQLSGVAAHLNPTYFKAWFRLASSLAKYELQSQREGKVCHPSVVARVVAHARNVLPHLSPQEQQMLENTLSTSDSFTTPDNLAQFCSYAEWCAVMDSLGFVFAEDNVTGSEKNADAWRKEGSIHFAKGDLSAAESCYRKGLAVTGACLRGVSIVLNNIAAVDFTLFREECKLYGVGEMSRTEAALLNSTVAAMLDSLNHKAWSRRTRCLEHLGFTDEECATNLQTIRSSVLSKTNDNAKVLEFKARISADIERLLQRSSLPHQASDTPTNVQAENRNTFRPPDTTEREKSNENPVSGILHGQDAEDIDDSIARKEGFVNRMRATFSAAKSKSNPRLQLLPREITMFLKNPPLKTHTEFAKLRGWPGGIDPTFARKVLYRAYLDACIYPWIPAHNMRTGEFFETISLEDRVKRWHGTGALEILRSRRFVKYGDVVDGREALGQYIPNYEARTRCNFANNPSRAEVYYLGTTHVAIGFNDFSGLLASTLRDIAHNGKPLKFVGFEMSEFAVAKCKVVAQMLGSSDVSILSVMEVWLSSVWSDTTLKDFQKSVNVILRSLREHSVNAKVASYIRHWASTEAIAADKAHSEFFLSLEKRTLPGLFSFRREIDRLNLIHYMLTGEVRASANVVNLLEKEGVHDIRNEAGITSSSSISASKKRRNRKKKKQQATRESVTAPNSSSLVGNLTMWSVPDGSPSLQSDIAFNTVDFMKLVEDYDERESKQTNSAKRLSVVDLFVIHIVKNLYRLRGLMLTNKLKIEVHYGVVKAVRADTANDSENQELLTRIARMRPDTMSWSNLLDYFLPEDFHDVARRCSMYGGCVHYAYSMNWPTQVFGASIIDYEQEHRNQAIDDIICSALGISSESKVLPIPSVVTMCKTAGLDKFLHLPFREHPLNSTAYTLAHMFNEEWVDNFMKKGYMTINAFQRLGASATPSNCELQMGAMDLAMPSPLYRSSLTLHMSWCYDPAVDLVADSLDLNSAFSRLMQHLAV